MFATRISVALSAALLFTQLFGRQHERDVDILSAFLSAGWF